MAANYVTIKGFIKDGELMLDLPENVQDGEVEVRVAVDAQASPEGAPQEIEPLWSEEELDALINPHPKTGAEIIALGHTGGWEHKGITDSVEWVKEQRRKRREKRGW